MTTRIGVYPGTFDPITKGHLNIIKRALKITDKLIIGVAEDTNKKTLFSSKKRASFIIESLQMEGIDLKNIEVLTFSGLLINFAKEKGASIIVRGLRAVSDFEYEFKMSVMNSKLGVEIETIFLPALESTQFISSQFVKEIARLGGDISPFVDDFIKNEVQKALAK